MLSIRHLSVSLRATEILADVSLTVNAGEVVAIAGANGCGKSTLLRAVFGEVPSSGSVHMDPSATVAFLRQETVLPAEGLTGLMRALGFIPEVAAIHAQLQKGVFDHAQDYADLGGYGYEADALLLARNFGVEDLLAAPFETLSFGQQRKVDLVGMLLADADLALYDEPVNFLDIQGISAFEEALQRNRQRGRATLLVSHDRELLDVLADVTVLLERGRSISVTGGYSDAAAFKEHAFQSQVDRARTLRNQIRSLEQDMRRRMGWGLQREHETRDSSSRRLATKMMKRSKAVESRLDRKREELESEKPWIEKPVRMAFPEYEVRSKGVISLEGVSKAFGDKQLLSGIQLSLGTKQRTALMGPNGCGKTTLLRLLSGEEQPDSGRVSVNASVNVGRLTQGLDGFFSQSVLLDNFRDYDETSVRQFLGAAKITGEKVLQEVSTLSSGELMRSAIVSVILQRSEFLIMDEPTAHLDLESLLVVERLLAYFPGGFLLVSHDRRLVSNVADEVLYLRNRRLERLG